LANNIGIIDPGYRGEVLVMMRKFRSNAVELVFPWKAVQILYLLYGTPNICVMGSFTTWTDRGDRGFGSSDKKLDHYYECRSAENIRFRWIGPERDANNLIVDFEARKIQTNTAEVTTAYSTNQLNTDTSSRGIGSSRSPAGQFNLFQWRSGRIGSGFSSTGRALNFRASDPS
jgi:hypothetical protein